MEEPKNEETWNKKRIVIAVFLFALLMLGGYFFKNRILGVQAPGLTKSIKGISTKEATAEPALKIDVQEAVKEKINNLKQEVSGLNILEIASSSPQVQKILNDIKSLEQYPVNQVKEICKKICGL